MVGSELRVDPIDEHGLTGRPRRWSAFEAAAWPSPRPHAIEVVGGNPARIDQLSPREREVMEAVATRRVNRPDRRCAVHERRDGGGPIAPFTELDLVTPVQLALHARGVDAGPALLLRVLTDRCLVDANRELLQCTKALLPHARR